MFYRNTHYSELSNQRIIGTLNMFIYGAIFSNPAMALFAPFIASIICCLINIDAPCQQGYVSVNSYLHKALSTTIKTCTIFVVSYLFYFFVAMIFDPAPSYRQYYYSDSLFISIYDRSMLGYCFCFIVYSGIYASIYSLLAFGLLNLYDNYVAAILPGVLCYYLIYIAARLVPNVSKSIFAYIIPFQTYDTTSGMAPLRYLYQLLTVLVIGIALNYFAIKKGVHSE